MRWKLASAASVLLFASHGAFAQFSSTITLTNDYDFRGVSLSAKDPALQGSLDYGFPSGFAVGAWASNIDYGDGVDGDLEVDAYATYTGEISEESSWVAGATMYTYPGSDDIEDYPEVYVGFNTGPFAFKQWYAWDFLGLPEEVSAWYTEAGATVELPQSFSLLLHLGYSWGDFWEASFADGGGGGELFDYSVGIGYALKQFSLALKYSGTDASGEQEVTGDVFNNEPRAIFTISTTLPWGE
jgi:uncharacterized protein (TIGR02001 family)